MGLDFFRHGSNALLALAILAAMGAWPLHPGFFVLGAVLFFLSEYGFHRFAFHAPPMHRLQLVLKLQHRLHYDHHLDPARLDLLFLPLWFVLPNLALTGAASWLIWPHLGAVVALLAGLAAAMLYYEWVHYLAHIPVRPRTSWGRWIKKVHLWHHFKNEGLWFGVTNPAMDMLLGSFSGVDSVAKSGTTRKLKDV